MVTFLSLHVLTFEHYSPNLMHLSTCFRMASSALPTDPAGLLSQPEVIPETQPTEISAAITSKYCPHSICDRQVDCQAGRCGWRFRPQQKALKLRNSLHQAVEHLLRTNPAGDSRLTENQMRRTEELLKWAFYFRKGLDGAVQQLPEAGC